LLAKIRFANGNGRSVWRDNGSERLVVDAQPVLRWWYGRGA
jgi:hypothetical protein